MCTIHTLRVKKIKLHYINVQYLITQAFTAQKFSVLRIEFMSEGELNRHPKHYGYDILFAVCPPIPKTKHLITVYSCMYMISRYKKTREFSRRLRE